MTKVSPRNLGGEGEKVKLTRRGRKPRTSFYHEPEPRTDWSLTSEMWDAVQDIYGHKLPDSLRSEIAEIVNDYFHFAQTERNKLDAEDAIAFLVKLEEKASSLAELLVGDLSDVAAASARDVLARITFSITTTRNLRIARMIARLRLLPKRYGRWRQRQWRARMT